MSKIIRLQSTNYKRLKAVEITPDGNVVTIGGKNGAGKSSVLDSITAALGGVSKKDTPKPIRDGEDNAEIVLETDELIVTRRFTKSGSTLTVTTPDGAKFPKGQAKLDDLIGKLSLDPLAFTQMDDKKQLETLLGLVDLPFDPQELERQRKDLYDQRAEVGRQGKAIGEVEVDESLPADEQSASELIQKIRENQEQHRTYNEAVEELESAQYKVQSLREELAKYENKVTQCQERLGDLPGELPDIQHWEDKLSTVEETNAKIRANNHARTREAEKARLRAQYEAHTDELKDLDKTKADGLAKAEMPVEGLGFDSDGVTYEGIPFKQTNTASQIGVSFAMAMAMNPKLRVIRIAEGSLLDEDNLKLVADMAEENDFQVWIESVGQGDGTGIVIEDGEVVNE